MADRPDAAPAARWIAPGDLGAFFALALDNLTNLVLLASILVGGFGFPADVFATRMVPGTALGVMVGDLAYTWMAMRLRHATGRADITAMPLGLDTPSTVGMAVAVLGPTWLATHDAMLTWHVGMAVMVLMAVVKTAAAFAGDWIRRVAPQAGLLGSIGGVGVALLGVLPLLHLFEAPIAGLAALGVVLYALIAGLGLPRRIPGALAAVVLGTALYYALGAAGEQPGFHWPTWHLQAAAPVPTLGFLDGLERAIDFLPLALPFALLTVVGGINVTESARAAGVTIASYSSGSIAAQRLIYAHSDRGDLTAHLAAYFDTTTGPKQAPASYAAIATALALPPARIAFVSDVVAELAAAAAAGMHAVLSVRPGNAPVAPGHGYPTIGTLDELALRPA